MTSASRTPAERIASLRNRVENATGPVTLSSMLNDTIDTAQTAALKGHDWTKLVFDSNVDGVKIESSADPSRLTLTGKFEAYDGAVGEIAVVAPGTGEAYFVCSFSFQPSFLSKIPQLSFLSDVNPGPFTLALASMAVEKFPLQVQGKEAEQDLFKGINFFSSINPTGVVQSALSDLLNTNVDSLTLSGGLDIEPSLSDDEDDDDKKLDWTTTVIIKAEVVGKHAFAGIETIQLTETAVVLSSTIKDGKATEMSTGLESHFYVVTPDGANPTFKGGVSFEYGEDAKVDVTGKVAMLPGSPVWSNALGIKNLNLDGVKLQIDIADGKPTIGLVVGSFTLGRETKSSEIKGSGTVNAAIIETPPYLDFSKCMVSLSVDHLPVGDLWEAVGPPTTGVIAEQVSKITIDDAQIYAVPQSMKVADKNYGPGFKLAGKVDVLGWSGSIEGEVKYSSLALEAATYKSDAFSVPTELLAFAYFHPLPASGIGFLVFTEPSKEPGGSFPAFPKPDLLPDSIPKGAKMAVRMGLEKYEAQIAASGSFMGAVTGDCVADLQPGALDISISGSADTESHGSVACSVNVQEGISNYTFPKTSKSSFVFNADVSSGRIVVTPSRSIGFGGFRQEVPEITIDGITVPATFTITLSGTLDFPPSTAFSGSVDGSFKIWDQVTIDLPSFSLSAAPETLDDLLSKPASHAADALNGWFDDASHVRQAITNGWIHRGGGSGGSGSGSGSGSRSGSNPVNTIINTGRRILGI